jgi:hypothetical protein
MAPHQKNVPDDVSTSYSNVTTEPTKTASPVTALKHRRRQRFSLKSNQIFPVVHIGDMDETDIHETWYEKRDYNAIKKSLIDILRKYSNGEKIAETSKQTLRGLESRTREGALLRQYLKLAAITAVLNEQTRQRDEGVQDGELLAKVYRDVASHCQEESRALALQDEAALKKDYEKMRRELALDLQKESGLKEKRRFKLVRFPLTRNLVRWPASRNLVSDSEKSPSGISGGMKQVRTLARPLPGSGPAFQTYAGKAA